MLKVREGSGILTPDCLSLEDSHEVTSHEVTHDDAAEGDGLEIPGGREERVLVSGFLLVPKHTRMHIPFTNA